MSYRMLIIILCVLSLILLGVLLKNKNFKRGIWGSILYLIVAAVFVGAGALLGNREWLSVSYHLVYIILSGWMLLCGIMNVVFLSDVLPWAGKGSYATEVWFTILTALLGGIVMLLVFQFISFAFYPAINLSALLMYILPYLFMGIVFRKMQVPIKIFRKWFYPVDQHVEDPTDREMESPLVVGFEFKKQNTDTNVTSFRAKAPKEMLFGKLFYYFINDYNHRNPDEKIQFLDNNEKPVGWVFYIKPKFFGKIRYIDPEETNSFNLIKENSVIVCRRVIET